MRIFVKRGAAAQQSFLTTAGAHAETLCRMVLVECGLRLMIRIWVVGLIKVVLLCRL